MAQEDKDLLLRDLCARIPYGVKGECKFDSSYSFDMIFRYHFFDAELEGIKNDGLYVRPLIEHFAGCGFANKEVADGIGFDNFTPYLRPMSSMTKEENEEFENQFLSKLNINENGKYSIIWNVGLSIDFARFGLIDLDLISAWLDKKMFDWRKIKKGNKRIPMIDAGLALTAPEGMYNF